MGYSSSAVVSTSDRETRHGNGGRCGGASSSPHSMVASRERSEDHTVQVLEEDAPDVISGGRRDPRWGVRFRLMAVAAVGIAAVSAGVVVVAVDRGGRPGSRHAGGLVSTSGLLLAAHDDLVVLGRPNTVSMVEPGDHSPAWITSVPGPPVAAAAGAGDTIWVATRDDAAIRPFLLLRLDLASGRIAAQVALADVPFSMAVTGDQVWVGTDGRLVRYAAATGLISAQVATDGAVTALTADPAAGRLYGLLTGRATNTVMAWSGQDGHPLARRVEPGSTKPDEMVPNSLAFGFGSLWVTTRSQDGSRGGLERLDAANLVPREPGAATDAGSEPGTITAGPTAMWLADTAGRVSCFRPTTPSYPPPRPFVLPGGPEGFEVTAGSFVVIGRHIYYAKAGKTADLDSNSVC